MEVYYGHSDCKIWGGGGGAVEESCWNIFRLGFGRGVELLGLHKRKPINGYGEREDTQKKISQGFDGCGRFQASFLGIFFFDESVLSWYLLFHSLSFSLIITSFLSLSLPPPFLSCGFFFSFNFVNYTCLFYFYFSFNNFVLFCF